MKNPTYSYSNIMVPNRMAIVILFLFDGKKSLLRLWCVVHFCLLYVSSLPNYKACVVCYFLVLFLGAQTYDFQPTSTYVIDCDFWVGGGSDNNISFSSFMTTKKQMLLWPLGVKICLAKSSPYHKEVKVVAAERHFFVATYENRILSCQIEFNTYFHYWP